MNLFKRLLGRVEPFKESLLGNDFDTIADIINRRVRSRSVHSVCRLCGSWLRVRSNVVK